MNIRGLWREGDPVDRSVLIVAGAALLIGVLARFLALGASPLSVDEYYLTVAAENTLAKGVPQWDIGGYYTRGVLQQYLALPFAMLLGDMGLALRVVSALSNLIALPAVYLLSRRIVGPTAALLAMTLFGLSIWEIEFARFARMYAIFQAFYIWSVYFLVRFVETGDQRFRHIVLALSALSIIVYEGAIFLVALNFLALLVGQHRPKFASWIMPVTILIASYLYVWIDFRHIGVGQYLPNDYVSSPGTGTGAPLPFDLPIDLPIERPPLLIGMLPDISLVLFGLLVAAMGVICVRLFRDDLKSGGFPLRGLWLALLIVLAAMNLYGLAIGAAVAVWLLGWQGRGWELSRNLVAFAGLHAALFAMWLGNLAIDRDWLEVLWGGEYGFAKGLVWTLFGYPDIYSKFLIRWLQSMPLMSLLAFGAIGGGIVFAMMRGGARDRLIRLLAAIIVLMVLALCILEQEYRSIRYSFFLYPLVLVLLVASVDRIAALLQGRVNAKAACALALGGLVLVSEDFGATHLLNIDEPEYMYRTAYDRWREDQYYRRWDYAAPAAYVNENADPEDIVITTSHVVPYYLDDLDYFYAHMSSFEFRGISAERGGRELWSGADLLYKVESLNQAIETADRTVWLIIRSQAFGAPREEERELARQYTDSKVFTSDDGNLEVYKVTATI